MGEGPLQGIRVLDLTQGVTGPYSTKLFSDYGADVIKVERPDGGDPLRRAGPFPGDVPNAETGGTFLHLNTGKRSLTLNLKTATGQQLLRRLAAEVDLIVESFRPGTLVRLGLDWETVSAANPGLSLVQVSNFGQDGPYRDFDVDDMLAYASGGVLQITGDPEREPLKIGIYAPLFLAGSVVGAMAMGAFMGGHRHGRGDRVDISIQEVLASSMDRGGPNLVAHEYSGDLMTVRQLARRVSAMPGGVYPCKDGYVHVNAQAAWFPRFCEVIDRPDLVDDEHLRSVLMDPEYGGELDALFYPWLMERGKQEVMEKAQAAGLPISAINSMEDVFSDPHLRERGFFVELDHPVAGPLEFPGFPLRMMGTPGEIRRAPLLGEHTSQILTEQLGYAKEDVVILRQRNVV